MIAHLALLAVLQQQASPPGAGRSYLFFVASEGTDEVALVRFGPKGLRVEHRTPIKLVPGDPAAPTEIYSPRYLLWDSLAPVRTFSLGSAHGFPGGALATIPRNITIAPDGRTYFVTTARGLSGGELVKVRIAADSGWRRQMATDSVRVAQPPDTVQAREPVTGVPGAIQVTRDGAFAWVTSAGSTGDDQPPGVSVVYLTSMIEVARIPTCAGPLGSRLTADGSRHYSVCNGDDALVEIDAPAMKVTRQLTLGGDGQRRCGPAAVAIVPDGTRVFIACAQSGDVVEVDARTWTVTRRLPVGAGAGELAVSADGRTLVAVNREAASVSVVDLVAGRQVAHIATSRHAPAAVAISPDDRYAFLTVSGTDAEPGSIDVIDLTSRTMVGSLEYGRKLAGIAFWKVER